MKNETVPDSLSDPSAIKLEISYLKNKKTWNNLKYMETKQHAANSCWVREETLKQKE